MKTQEERIAERKEIKKYCNHAMYTDVEPYEVVRVVSPITVEIRAMDYKQIRFPQQFHVGGFAAHCADNRSGQEYEYSSNPENPIIRVRWSKAKKQWMRKGNRYYMSDTPYRFYDYNF